MTDLVLPSGRFRFTAVEPSGRWWWSDGLFALHGMAAGEVVPTQAVFLSHVHPDDSATVRSVLRHASGVTTPEPRSCQYRLRDFQGVERVVVLAVGSDDSAPGVISGSVVDVTQERHRAVAEGVNAQLALALEAHASIDQAKGVLMLALGMDSVEAFELLRCCSQRLNIRLHALADRLVAVASRPTGADSPARGPLVDILVSLLRSEHGDPLRVLSSDDFDVTADRTGATTVLRIAGRMDVAHAIRLAVAIRIMQLDAGPAGFVVDVRDLDTPDAPVLDILATAARTGAGRSPVVVMRGGASATATGASHRRSARS